MNILVTGGAGYIGSHTCVELLASILLDSKLGMVMTLATFAFQMLLLYFSLFRKEGESILKSFTMDSG